ncbi:hypothetical protein AURDEDRAFT_59449 [Auricularia subglabra TFB-10046 SS5]|nr:hypothetical protein AURDEDRAFT_59449 [Auricularia subglabra TFB-10046 SS5]
MNPNFPHGLNIAASHDPLKLQKGDCKTYSNEAQDAAIARYGIAGRVWEASYRLAAYLNPASSNAFDPPCSLLSNNGSRRVVLELGSGSGYVGRHLARACDRLVCTDLEDVCGLLRDNLRDLPTVDVQSLPWGDVHAARALQSTVRPTHVVCCDLIYFPELLAPLLRTLLALTDKDSGTAAEIILAYKMRSQTKEGPFWAAFGMWFAFERVAGALKATAPQEPDELFLFTARRKAHTLAWPVPDDDAGLLHGAGLPNREGSDAFELMLLMAMTPS